MLNRIILMGRLTRDPELRRTGNGTAVTSFSLAVDRDYKSQAGARRRTTEAVVDSVYFGDSKRVVSDSDTQQSGEFTELPDEEKGELPF